MFLALLCPPGSLSFIFNIHANVSLVLAVIPPVIYLALCFKLKANTQITIAAVLSVIYAFLMLVVTMSIIGELYSNRYNFMLTQVQPLKSFLEGLLTPTLIIKVLHTFISLQAQW